MRSLFAQTRFSPGLDPGQVGGHVTERTADALLSSQVMSPEWTTLSDKCEGHTSVAPHPPPWAAREREEAPLALRATRPHTVGYIGVCDQEEGGVRSPCRQRLGAARLAGAPSVPRLHPGFLFLFENMGMKVVTQLGHTGNSKAFVLQSSLP